MLQGRATTNWTVFVGPKRRSLKSARFTANGRTLASMVGVYPRQGGAGILGPQLVSSHPIFSCRRVIVSRRIVASRDRHGNRTLPRLLLAVVGGVQCTQMIRTHIIDTRDRACRAWLGKIIREVRCTVVRERSRRRLRLIQWCRDGIVLRTIMDLTDQFAHTLSFIAFPARFPFFATPADLLCQLRIDHLMHFSKISSPTRSMSKLEKVSAFELQGFECFLPIVGKSILRKPEEHAIQWPLYRSFTVR